MIQVSNLTKKFDDFCAVNDISFTVQPGEVLGFLGPNGAGKSTTMKILTGFLNPTAGSVSVMGHDVLSNPISAKSEIGYLPEGAPAYADMTVIDSLNFIGEVRGFRGRDLSDRIEQVVKKVALEPVLNKKVETLSKGYCRRLGIAQALLHDPKVLILDEPTDGLDPNQKHQVRELIRDLSEDKTVIVSTHILEEVSAVCTRAMILAQGTILFDGTPEELAAKSEHHNAVRIKLAKSVDGLNDKLKQLPEVKDVRLEGDDILVLPVDGQSILPTVNPVLHEANCLIEALHVETGQLDDVFRSITTSAQSVSQQGGVSA